MLHFFSCEQQRRGKVTKVLYTQLPILKARTLQDISCSIPHIHSHNLNINFRYDWFFWKIPLLFLTFFPPTNWIKFIHSEAEEKKICDTGLTIILVYLLLKLSLLIMCSRNRNTSCQTMIKVKQNQSAVVFVVFIGFGHFSLP